MACCSISRTEKKFPLIQVSGQVKEDRGNLQVKVQTCLLSKGQHLKATPPRKKKASEYQCIFNYFLCLKSLLCYYRT